VIRPAIRLGGADEASTAIAIWKEAALWLIAREQALWTVEEFDAMPVAQLSHAGQLVLGFDGEDPVAVMTLQDEDELHWPDARRDSALYLHKLAVRRAHAGQGWSARMLEWACARARQRRRPFLRLDCSPIPKLTQLYEAQGFARVDERPVLAGRHLSVRFERAAFRRRGRIV